MSSQPADRTDPDDLLLRDRQHLIHALHSAAAHARAHVWVRGEGVQIFDQTGQAYYDALSGLWNVVLGHGRAELAEAAARQMRELAYASAYAGSTNLRAIELGERLAALCYADINRFYLTCGGGESNETAFKTARFYWKSRGQAGKWKVIGREWGYHGTTLAAMAATGISTYWPMFEPRPPGFLHIASPYPYRFEPPESVAADDPRTRGQIAADLLEDAILREGPETVAAFIGEPVQGAGGVIVPQDDYWPRIRAICDRHQVLLIADEVITGFGRTGEWFGLSRYGIAPDIITFAKGITSGYFPLGGVGVSDEIAAAIDEASGAHTWMHAYTYSGHPVGCAVALATLDIIEREGLVEQAADVGRHLLTQLATLAAHPHVGDVRGLGLMAAVELVADKATKRPFEPQEGIGPKVHEATQRRGMFTRLRGDVYNIAPPLVTSKAEIDRMVEILGDSIQEVLGA